MIVEFAVHQKADSRGAGAHALAMPMLIYRISDLVEPSLGDGYGVVIALPGIFLPINYLLCVTHTVRNSNPLISFSRERNLWVCGRQT